MMKFIHILHVRRAITAVGIAAVALTMASSALTASAAPATPARTVVFSQSRATVAYIAALAASADRVDSAVASCRTLLAASSGLVADDSVRMALGAAIDTAGSASVNARRELGAARLTVSPSNRSLTGYLGVILDQLNAAQAAVTASEAQQVADIVAQKTAAARAEEAAAAAAARAAANVHTVNVWTAGWQTQIDQCHGGVDISAHYGTATIAERWQCGGSSFPTTPGTTVRITGARAGTYTVLGVARVLDAYTSDASQVPQGYDLLYQTCSGGNAHHTSFIALRRQ
jgi:hypothetical protein